MTISASNCKPYVSVTLFKLSNEKKDFLKALRKDLKTELQPSDTGSTSRQFLKFQEPEGILHGLSATWIKYEERRPPAWYAMNDLQNSNHHIVVLIVQGSLLALCCSDNSARSSLVRAISKAKRASYKKLTRFSPSETENAFVEEKIRTLWLSGAHRRSLVKPDAKVLSGLELENALDPLDDQSYYYSAVRSTSSNVDLETSGRGAIVGASPKQARIWLGPSGNWAEFQSRVQTILKQASDSLVAGAKAKGPIPVLARPTDDISKVQQPYDLAIVVPEQLIVENTAKSGSDRWLQQFADQAEFKICAVAGKPDFEADVLWGDEKFGRLSFIFEKRADGSHGLKISTQTWENELAHQEDILEICKDAENCTIYFDTGHTFSSGQFYETQFRDAKFEDWTWVNMSEAGVKVKREKPSKGQKFIVDDIGQESDESLFGFIVKKWPKIDNPSADAGWLVCDDGAGESADFIHFNDVAKPAKLTLIHAKGSGSEETNRQISVSDYEVVVGQAIKNLRHMDRGLLKKKLSQNAEGSLKNAVWHNGKRQNDRSGFLKALDDAGGNFDREVIILQPRVRKAEYESVRAQMADGTTNASTKRLQQLDALLLGARASCRSLGAGFRVVSDV